MTIPERWHSLQVKIDSLSTRERGLVFLSIVAVLYLLWELIVFAPVGDGAEATNKQLLSVISNIEEMRREERMLLVTRGGDPDRALRQELAELNGQLSALDTSLADLQAGLVPVEKLTSILQELLSQADSLELVSMTTLPAEELVISGTTEANVAEKAGIYKHSVSVTVSGRYFQVMKYLQTLESMPWRIYWDELHFDKDQQEQYPEGIYTLKVYTLSTDEGLLGV